MITEAALRLATAMQIYLAQKGMISELAASAKIGTDWPLTAIEVQALIDAGEVVPDSSMHGQNVRRTFRAQVEKIGRMIGIAESDIPKLAAWAEGEARPGLDKS